MNSNPDIPWSLGIDLGTGSCKSVVLACDGRILGFGASRYGAQDDTQRWKEQNPEALLRGMTSAVKTSLANAGVSTENCQGIGLGGAMHTVMAVDRIGRPLTGIVTWVDDRAVPQAQAVRASTTTHELYRRTGCSVHCIYPLYKIAWLREERQGIFHEARHFISAKEYVY
ncbi:MAG: FGGY family carbohydrate kinase, partial [Anaerolineaceae bacterium]